MTGPDPAQITQRVTDAVVVGDITMVGYVDGDLTVFKELPAYRLEPMPLPAADAQTSPAVAGPSHRDAPSYLLDAAREIVPFHGRDTELAELVRWRDTATRCAIRLISGPGGQGKSRLAAEFARRSRHAGWIVLTAVERADTHLGTITEVGGHASRHWPQGMSPSVLVIVDYADRWRLEALVGLLRELEYRSAKSRARVLLLARHGSSLWESVASELDRGTVALSPPLVLGELHQPAHREIAFQQASQAFHAALGAGPGPIDPPADLDHPDYGSPLTLHMAALAAVHACIEATPAPTRDDLPVFLLRRERRYWQRMCRAAPADAGSEPVSADTMAHVAYLATLFGPLPIATASAALQHAGLADGAARAHALLAFHKKVYPLDDPSAALSPLRPDRLGEDYVAHMLGGDEGGYLWQTAIDLAGTAIGELRTDGTPNAPVVVGARAGRHFLTLLTAAAEDDRHPRLRPRLFAFLASTPRLAVCVDGHVLDFLNRTAPTDLLAAVQRIVPFSTELLHQKLVLAQRLLDDLPADAPMDVRATRTRHASAAQSQLGHRHAALAHAEQAVDIYRRLAAADPETHLPELANGLSNLGIALQAVNRRDDALAAGQEAVRIFRRLTKAEHVSQVRVGYAAHLPDMAGALSTLACRLMEAGHPEPAVDAAQEAVSIFRALETVSPRSYLPELGSALTHLGSALSDVGRDEDAVAACQAAVDIYRGLAAARPATHLPGLAVVLNNLAGRKAAVGDAVGAALLNREGIEIFRDLAEQYPGAYQEDLARALANLKLRLLELGEPNAAAGVGQEAISVLRSLTAVDSSRYAPGFASFLHQHALQMEMAGDLPTAIAALQECVHLRRRLAHEDPDHLPGLAAAIRDQGALLWTAGDRQTAMQHTEEAVSRFRSCAAEHRQQFARTLSNYYAMLSAEDHGVHSRLPIAHELVAAFRFLPQHDTTSLNALAFTLTELAHDILQGPGLPLSRDAVELAREAVTIRRGLATADEAQLPSLAHALYCLHVAFRVAGAKHDALQAIQESVGIYHELSRDDPTHLPTLADSLNALAALRSDLGDRQRAAESARENVDVWRRLAAADSSRLPQLANAFNRFAQHAGEQAVGLAGTREATSTYRRLAESDPAIHRARLAVWLTNLVMRSEEAGDRASASAALHEAATICKEMVLHAPGTLSPDLAETAFKLTMILVHRGDPPAAQAFGLEAVKAYERLDKHEPGNHLTGLAKAYLTFAIACHEARTLDHAEAAAQLAIQTFDRLEPARASVFHQQRQMAQDVLDDIAAGR